MFPKISKTSSLRSYLSTGPSSTMDSSPPSDSATSTKPDSNSWREESTFLSSEKSNEQPPNSEPATETSSGPGEERPPRALLLDLGPILRATNDHQKKKFSKLRKRMWEFEIKYDRLWENHLAFVRLNENLPSYTRARLRLHEQCFYFVGVMWCISMCFIAHKISTISS
jgi:hypothetical protein